jgi:hypothetical protein
MRTVVSKKKEGLDDDEKWKSYGEITADIGSRRGLLMTAGASLRRFVETRFGKDVESKDVEDDEEGEVV